MIYKWGDLISLEYGKPVADKETTNGTYPVYGTNGQIGTTNLPPLCPHASVILGRKGAYRGVHYSQNPFSVIDTAFYFKSKIDKLDLKWVYYKFLTYDINRMDSGSAIPSTDRYEIYSVPVKLPSLQEQRAVANTLSVLDAKIVANKQINHHLEQMAQAIFKSWFVDFEPWCGTMPEGWREGTLSEIATITMGQSPDGSSYNEDGIGAVFYQGRAEFGSRFPTRRLFTTQSKRMAVKGDVLMSVRAPVGDLNVAYESCCLGRGLAGIQSNNGCQSFVLYTMYALKQQLDMFNGEGTVFGSINKNDMASLPVLIPSNNVLRQFEELISPMDVSIEANYAESYNLQATRDSLLPRLMSGELSVADLGDAK